ncbi:MAG TPA: hypothetical protein VKA46_10795 [Gemmataceae bacterium]|nr:hypothetical protein [Gemmataceae bacterium]
MASPRPGMHVLSPAEEDFLQALLWEEGHLLKDPATCRAEERGLSLLRCLFDSRPD